MDQKKIGKFICSEYDVFEKKLLYEFYRYNDNNIRI